MSDKPAKTPRSAKKAAAKTGWLKRWAPATGMGDRMFRQMPYFGFVSALALAMVWNVHRAQETLRDIETARTELQEMRWHASAVQSRIMYDNKQSEVLKRMRDRDLGLAGSSPRRLVASLE